MKKIALILAYIAVLNFLSFHFAKNGMIKLLTTSSQFENRVNFQFQLL